MTTDLQTEYGKLANERGFFIQTDWNILEISGKDGVKFLHNLVSQDIANQPINTRTWNTLLTSKGRLIGFFQVWKFHERLLLLIHKDEKENVFKELEKYWITEDLQFRWCNEFTIVSAFMQSQEMLIQSYEYETDKIVKDPIIRCSVDDYFIPCVQMLATHEKKNLILEKAFPMSEALFESIRIGSQFPKSKVDYNDPIPIEVPFMHRAVSFTKGCYVGQETIARLHARGLHVSKKLTALFQRDSTSTIQTGDKADM